jgi:hypothetical protein
MYIFCIHTLRYLWVVATDGVWIRELDLLVNYRWSLHFTNHYRLSFSQPVVVPTASNSGHSSVSRTHVVTVQRISRNWTESAGQGSSLYSLGAGPTENTVSNSQSIAVMGVCLTIGRIPFPRERVYGAVAQKRPFVYSPIAYQRLYSLLVPSLPSNGSIGHNTFNYIGSDLVTTTVKQVTSWRLMGSGGIDPPFLTYALDGGQWSASRPGRFTSRGKSPPPVPIG